MAAELPNPGSGECRHVKARKVYICDDCRVAIVPRQLYYSIRGVWDDKWRTYRLCEPCLLIRDRFNFWGEDGPPFGELELELKMVLDQRSDAALSAELLRYRARQQAYRLSNTWLSEPGGETLAEFVESLDGVTLSRGFKLYNKKFIV